VLAKLKAGRPPFAPVPVAIAPAEGAAPVLAQLKAARPPFGVPVASATAAGATPVLRQTESSDVERDDIGIECTYKPQ
jgi:hypothetical protein